MDACTHQKRHAQIYSYEYTEKHAHRNTRTHSHEYIHSNANGYRQTHTNMHLNTLSDVILTTRCCNV